MRGTLVAYEPAHTPTSPQVVTFDDFTGAERDEAAFSISKSMDTALNLSLCIAALLTVLFTWIIALAFMNVAVKTQAVDRVRAAVHFGDSDAPLGGTAEVTTEERNAVLGMVSSLTLGDWWHIATTAMIKPLKNLMDSANLFAKRNCTITDSDSTRFCSDCSRQNAVSDATDPDAHEPICFREFIRRYQRFCFIDDWKENENSNAIHRMLVKDFGCKMKLEKTRTLCGVRILPGASFSPELRDLSINEAVAKVRQSRTDGMSAKELADTAVRQFFSVCCYVTGNADDYVIWESTGSIGAADGVGKGRGQEHHATPVARDFAKFCTKLEIDAPDLEHIEQVFENRIDGSGSSVAVKHHVEKTIQNMRWRDIDGDETVVLGLRFYVIEAYVLSAHAAIVIVITLAMHTLVSNAQHQYLESTFGFNTQYESIGIADRIDESSVYNTGLLVSIRFVYLFSAIGMASFFIRILAYYADIPREHWPRTYRVVEVVKILTAAVCVLFALAFLYYVLLVVQWVLVGMLLKPTDLAIYGVSIITVICVLNVTSTKLHAKAHDLKTKAIDIASADFKRRFVAFQVNSVRKSQSAAASTAEKNVGATVDPKGKIHRVDPDFGSFLTVSNRDSQSKFWVNWKFMGQPCAFQARAPSRSRPPIFLRRSAAAAGPCRRGSSARCSSCWGGGSPGRCIHSGAPLYISLVFLHTKYTGRVRVTLTSTPRWRVAELEQELMFASCDIDCDGVVNETEWLD
jgi:hypothetical protein